MQREKRTKPRKLKPSIKRFIFQEAIRQRNVPRELLANRLIKEIEEAGEVPPSLETAKRYISKARNAFNPIDKPWTLAACRDYPTFFPPTSLLFLVKMQQQSKKFVDIVTNASSQGFSIRKAMWIVRLQPLIEQYFRPDTFQQEYEILINVAEVYSLAERTSETMGQPTFDSSDLDDSLCSQDLRNILLFTFKSLINSNKKGD